MDYNLWQQLILGATKPFRTGANILAQNWGSALTGKDMSQSENQGGFLKWLAGGITPEEQQVINDKPYLSALKSGAGMASTLAPFGTQGLRAAQFASNPLTNRLAQLASQGALEGGLGGFGYSREGKEVQDTLTGAGMGAGGELLMDYLTNPQFRKMLTDASTYVDPNTGGRMYRGALGNDDDILFSNDLSKVPETPKDLGADIENLAEFTDSNNPDSGMDLRNIDLKDTKYPPVDIPDDIEITNYQDYDNTNSLYHGTAEPFEQFDANFYGKGVGWKDQGDGIYLTESKEAAQEFGNIAARNKKIKTTFDLKTVDQQTGKVLTTRLDKNTKILDFDTFKIPTEEAKKILRKAGIKEDLLRTIANEDLSSTKRMVTILDNLGNKENSYKFLTKELGYDGIRLTDPRWTGYVGDLSTTRALPKEIKTIVVYDPKKISINKSVKELRGGFKEILKKSGLK
jgi:hypothetical protein